MLSSQLFRIFLSEKHRHQEFKALSAKNSRILTALEFIKNSHHVEKLQTDQDFGKKSEHAMVYQPVSTL